MLGILPPTRSSLGAVALVDQGPQLDQGPQQDSLALLCVANNALALTVLIEINKDHSYCVFAHNVHKRLITQE